EGGGVLVWRGGGEAPCPALPLSVPQAPQPATQETAFLQATPLPAAPSHAAERRQLTVLFCDLVDSTRLARRFDPEDWREMVRAYQEACATVIQRFDGSIAHYLGDGLLVYFGYPQAHEVNERRAVAPGLTALETIRS